MFEYTERAIHTNLNALILGRKIELHSQVDSTNDLAREAGRRGEPEGLVVVAEEQVKGRGRMGRAWSAPAGSSVLCSVLLRPRFSTEQAYYLTIAAALAIYRAVGTWTKDEGRRTKDEQGIPHSIKWPNDMLVNGRKVAGVLSESEFVGGEWRFAVVGFGINVNLDGDDLTKLREVAPQATSLSTEWGWKVDRAALLGRVLTEMEGLYLAMQNGQFVAIYDEWAAALETVGKRVSVMQNGQKVSGQAVRVGRDGSLVIRTGGGIERSILAGDVVA